ncbi:OsmC family protein [Candidatus Sumerlaeota bacterium]|nr:OsmC family protein [Candidatus Sumerlaeota bacterium]
MGVKATVEYQGDLICKSTHGPSGQSIITEAPVDNGGQGRYFSPTDLVGVSAATCAMTIIGIAAKNNGLDVAGMTAEVEKEMVADPVRRIAKLIMTINLPAHLSEADRQKLEAAGNGCPVKKSLHPDCEFIVEYRYKNL